MWVAACMGIITGAFGGVLRDLLINEEPLIFRKDIYATACLAGCIFYWIAGILGASYMWQGLICAIVIIGVRILTLVYNLSFPPLAPTMDGHGVNHGKEKKGH